ncbi:MAG: hypothetical protein ACREV8_15990 [Gammaproteobacteria bacterium]
MGCTVPFASAAGGLGVVATRAADFGVAALATGAMAGRAAGTGTAGSVSCGGGSFGKSVPSGRTETVLTFFGSISSAMLCGPSGGCG